MKQLSGIILLGLVVLLGGCATTNIHNEHPLYAESAEEPHADVYFVRPFTQRSRGVADSPLKVELDEIPALSLAIGEYALLRLKPTTTDIIVRNLTFMTAQVNPVEVWRARRYKFEAGKTYYVVMKQEHEEFRGIYFIPELVDPRSAAEVAQRLRPAGALAKDHRIAGS